MFMELGVAYSVHGLGYRLETPGIMFRLPVRSRNFSLFQMDQTGFGAQTVA
jgi:hypothetical protein